MGAVAALVALRLMPASEYELGPAVQVSARAQLGRGETVLAFPPLGTVSATTHSFPLRFEVALAQVDLPSVGRALADTRSQALLVANIERGLRDMAIELALRLGLAGAVLGAVAAGLLPHRTWAFLFAGASGGALAIGIALFVTGVTFSVESFEEPRYSGALERAPAVIEALDRGLGSLDQLRSRFAAAADRVSGLLTLVAEPRLDPSEESVALLHVSDIHSNPLGIEITNQLAREFEVDAVVDTGDLTSFGQPLEGRLGQLIKGIPAPYLFVPGNHDSTANRNRLDAVPNVELLDEATRLVSGIEILGWADPTFTADEETSTEEGNEIRLFAAGRVAEAVEATDPDVLAVHDARLAGDSIGEVPVILAGHTHKRGIERVDGTLMLTVGSTGATGLGSLLVEGAEDYEAEVVYFRNGQAVALDYVRFQGLGGDFEVQRRTLIEPES